jgi:hypothetical protein
VDDLEDQGDTVGSEPDPPAGDDPPLETGTEEVGSEAEPTFCDGASGLVEVAEDQCAVLVTPDPAWVEAGTFGGVLVLASLGALVVGQLRRS